MPELKSPPQIKDTDLERIEYLFAGSQEPDDAEAAKLVTDTFHKYESQRRTIENRWDTASRLYHGVIDQRNWPGTDVPRAALPVPIVYDQVEAAYPIICEALFTYWPTFFEVSPQPGTTTAEAAQVRDVLAAYLETPFDDSGITPVSHMKMAVKQAEKFGDGLIEISWDPTQSRFIVEWVDAREFYMDPTTPGPVVDWSPSVVRRKLMTVQDLVDLRGTDGVNIPPDDILNYMAKSRFMTTGDQVVQREAQARKENYDITALRVDPRHQLVEVLIYWTKDRLIWTLGRSWTAINQKNPYGFIPYCRAPYTMVEGRPYSMSIPDVLEGNQKYAQGIRNARLDNLALIMNPPRKRAQGTPTTPGKLAWKPGMIDDVSKPEQSEVFEVQNATADAYQEEQFIHGDSDKRTGVNQMAQSGMPQPSNANRSATGVAAQQKSTGTRLSTPVSYFEEFMIVPLLYKAAKLISKFAPEQLQVVTKDGQTVTAPKSVFSKGVQFRMEGANRMMVKERLAMFLGPVSQMIFNPDIMHQANLQGKTVDFNEWNRFFQDATGTSRAYTFFRDASQQEIQSMNQPDPKTAAMLQSKQLESQTRLQMGQMKQQGEMNVAQLDAQTKQHGASERSAVDILRMLQKDRADHWKNKNDQLNAGKEKSTGKS